MGVKWERDAQQLRVTLHRDDLLELGLGCVAVVLGAAQAWACRFQPSTMDLVAYLDVGDAYRQGHWHDALNAYWNPLYSWVLGVVVALVEPSAQNEYPIAKLVDFAIYLGCLVSFRWFLVRLRAGHRHAIAYEGKGHPPIPDWVWIVTGYTLFLWSSLSWLTVTSNTPDMLAAALMYGAWGLWLGLEEREGPFHHLLLGLVLALSYFARTPMFIVGGVIVGMVALQDQTWKRRRGALTAGLVFLGLTAPFIVSISLARGHLTIGDNGMLNHVWLASPGGYAVPNRHWQGGPPGNGYPRHPSRLLWDRPPTFEFATPIGGTYPPWTDPSYWYEGLRFHFDWRAEWSSLTDNLQFDLELFGGWLLALVASVVCVGDASSTLRAIGRNTRFWAPAAIGLVLYLFANDLLVQRTPTPQPPSRYIAAFAVVLSGLMVSSLRFRPVRRGPIVTRMMGAMVMGLSVVMVATLVGRQWAALCDAQPTTPWQVTRDLEKTGVSPGLQVATIGSPSLHVLWARLARVHIIAEVPDERMFWATSPENRALVLHALARTGAQAAVSSSLPDAALDEGWQLAADTYYGVRALVPADAEARVLSHPAH